jgi:hypothetical protein
MRFQHGLRAPEWTGLVGLNAVFRTMFFAQMHLHTQRATFIAAGSWLCCVLALQIESMAEVSVGDIVRGYVKSTTESGCFVSVGRDCVARVTIARLSDAFISDWKVRRQSVVWLALHFLYDPSACAPSTPEYLPIRTENQASAPMARRSFISS